MKVLLAIDWLLAKICHFVMLPICVFTGSSNAVVAQMAVPAAGFIWMLSFIIDATHAPSIQAFARPVVFAIFLALPAYLFIVLVRGVADHMTPKTGVDLKAQHNQPLRLIRLIVMLVAVGKVWQLHSGVFLLVGAAFYFACDYCPSRWEDKALV